MVARTKLDLNVVFSKPLSLFKLGYTFHYSISRFTFQSSMSPFSCILHFSLFNVNAGTKMIAGTELDCLLDCVVVGGEHTSQILNKTAMLPYFFKPSFLTWSHIWRGSDIVRLPIPQCQPGHMTRSSWGSPGGQPESKMKIIFKIPKGKCKLFTKPLSECHKDCGRREA